MRTKKRQFGDWGEGQAASFLRSKQYDIIAQNYAKRGGEIDIIAWHEKPNGKTLCFVEVKTRRGEAGSAERATNYQKLERLMMTARQFAIEADLDLDRVPMQFEQVSVYLDPQTDQMKIDHFEIPMS